MKTKSRVKNIFFILFLLFAVFGIFFLFLLWTHYRNPQVPNPQGNDYCIKAAVQRDVPDIIHYDFEQPQPEEAIFSNVAHSGSQSLCAYGKRCFSSRINIPMSEIDPGHASHMAVAGWVNIARFENPLDACLAFTITNPRNDVLFSRFIFLKGKDYEQGKWFRITSAFSTDKYTYNPDDRIRIYLWNNSDNDILLDDLDIISGSQIIQGDSVYSNLSDTNTFKLRPNFPPYPNFLVIKEQIGNGDSEYIINNGNEKSGSFSNNEKLLPGNFIHPHGSTQDILSISHDKLELFWFSKNDKKFSSIATEEHGIPLKWITQGNFLNGDFNSDHYDELLIVKKNSDSLLLLNSRMNGNKGFLVSKTWLIFPDHKAFVQFHSLDANGDGTVELLAIESTGQWELFKFSGQKLGSLQNKGNIIEEWNSKIYNYCLVSGRFDQTNKSDCIQTLFKNRNKGKSGFFLLRFDLLKNDFIRTYHTPDGMGRNTGIDSLKITDELYPVRLQNGKGIEIMRRRNDWRFDLKLIELNDTSYTLIDNIDFEGYPEDHNPKYQEYLQIIPGYFIYPDRSSLLVIARQRHGSKEKSAFPNTVQIYSPVW